MPMMDVPMMSGDQVVVERRVGKGGNRGLSPVVPQPGVYSGYPHTFSMTDHQNHFHIDIRPPTLEPIPRRLQADEELMTAADFRMDRDLVEVIQEMKSTLDAGDGAEGKGDYVMFIDTPTSPENVTPVVLVAQATNASANTDRVLGVCFVVSNNGSEPLDSASYMTSFVTAARNYLRLYEGRNVSGESGRILSLTTPRHGVLQQQDSENGTYSYFPNTGFFGTDTVTAVVEIAGYSVKVIQTFKVVNSQGLRTRHA